MKTIFYNSKREIYHNINRKYIKWKYCKKCFIIQSKRNKTQKKSIKDKADRLNKEQNEKDIKQVKQTNKSTSEMKTKKADISKKSPQVKKKTAKKVSKK